MTFPVEFNILRVDPRCSPLATHHPGSQFVRADYALSCHDSEYRFFFFYALCMVAVYPVGIPVTFMTILIKYRDKIKTRVEHEEHEENNCEICLFSESANATEDAEEGLQEASIESGKNGGKDIEVGAFKNQIEWLRYICQVCWSTLLPPPLRTALKHKS